jgi:hypothetical protein
MLQKKIRFLFTAYLLIGMIILSISNKLYGQVYGCKDPLANNYNSLATVNDGSCNYSTTLYTPPIKADPINGILTETSGLQMAGNFLWSFNDGGGAAAIYRIDTLTNALLQTVILSGVTNIDWEDIAFDGTNLYIGDIGNNVNGARADLKIYKFPLSAIPDYVNNPIATIPANQIAILNYSYSDQPIPLVAASINNTKFDCAAMIVDGGKIHLFTKNWIELTTTHYEINGLTAGTYVATPLETLATNYLVTAADKAYSQKTVALMGYKPTGTAVHYLHLLTDFNGGNYFNGNKRQIELPDVSIMGQAEGLCFRTATYGYISNEKFARTVFPGFDLTVNQKLRSFDIANFVSTAAPIYIFNGNGNWDVTANWINNMAPPAAIGTGSEIIIDPVPGGQCILNIPYTLSAGAKLSVNTEKAFVVQGNLIVQ